MRSVEFGALGGAPDACFVFDPDGRLLGANPASVAALDCSLEDMLGRSAWEIFTCLTPTGFRHMVEAIQWEGPQTLLGHLRRRDGLLLSTETRLWGADNGGGRRVYALAREMRGCNGLIEERDQLAHVMEASSEIVLLFDDEHRLTYANGAALKHLGIPHAEDANGLSLRDLVVSEQRAFIDEVVVPALRSRSWDGELALRSWAALEARTPCWAHAFSVSHTRTGQRVGFALTARDISARQAVDQQRTRLLRLAEISRSVALYLLEEDELNRAVFEILEGVAGVLNVERAYLHRLRDDGRWLLRTHEWTRAGGPVHRKEGPEGGPPRGHWSVEELARGEALRIDRSVTSEGHESLAGLMGANERALLLLPMLIHGRLEGAFDFAHERDRPWADDEVAAIQLIVGSFARGVERQITERERALSKRDLEEAVERERVANNYKSEFLASMSHELRTPMSAIRGYAELLTRPNTEPGRQKLWIQNLRRSSEYLLGLLHDVLDLSKIEAGHMQLDHEPAALAEILRSVEGLLASSAREKGLELSTSLVGELPETIDTDPVRLKQILVNLVGNAIKFTDTGQVSVRLETASSAEGEPRLVVVVSDTGMGIPPEAIEKLFRPFSQVHRRAGGTGLGLQISKSLAQLLGGDIRVKSEVGKGTVFTLEFPLRGARGRLRELPDPGTYDLPAMVEPPVELAAKRILVVDDSRENREVLGFLLQEAGASFESAINGQAGLQAALAAEKAGEPFDAILMDMNMPVMNGFEATRALVRAGVSSPVIALTALALSGDEERCREAGCVAYVGKPIIPTAFFEILARHVGSAGGAQASAGPLEAEPAGPVLSLAAHPRFRGLVERYVASFPELADRLRALERSGRLDEVRTLVHRLRGTAATYGFPEVSHAAGRCEDSIRAEANREEISRCLEDLLGRLIRSAAG